MSGDLIFIGARSGGSSARAELIEIAALKLSKDSEDSEDFFSTLIRPDKMPSPALLNKLGIKVAELKEAPDANGAGAEFAEFFSDDAFVVAFDDEPLRSQLRGLTGDVVSSRILSLNTLFLYLFPLRDSVSELLRAEEECRRLPGFFSECMEKVSGLPDSLVSDIARVIGGSGKHPLRRFLRFAGEGKSGGGNWITSIPAASRPKRKRVRNEDEDWKSVPVEKVEGVFSEQGLFSQRLGGFEFRPEQVAMAGKIAECFNGSKHLMAEAGTGVGKSLAYLVPSVYHALENDVPIVVSTNTKNLQAQLFTKDLPRLREMSGIEFSSALIKGRRNYLCLKKLSYLFENAMSELEAEQRRELFGVCCWALETESGELAETRLFNESGGGLADRITSIAEDCAGRECRFYKQCFLFDARAKAAVADIVVTNHAFVFADMTKPASSRVLPDYFHVVFDEAHNIEDAAANAFAREVTRSRIRFVAGKLKRPGGKRGRGLLPVFMQALKRVSGMDFELVEESRGFAGECASAVEDIEVFAQPFFEELASLMETASKEGKSNIRMYPDTKREERWKPLVEAKTMFCGALAAVLQPLKRLLENMEEMDEDVFPQVDEFYTELHACSLWIREYTEDIEFILKAEEENYVCWIENNEYQGGACMRAAPVNVGPLLYEMLYKPKESVVFTSATLSVCGSTEFMRRRLGADLIAAGALEEICLGAPFNYPEQCLVMVPMFLPEPGDRKGDYAGELGMLMSELFRRAKGGGMALFTSYEMLRKADCTLRDNMPDGGRMILTQGQSGSRERITEQFKENGSGILMGTHSFWEGVDASGESLSSVVIARLPFHVFTDPLIQARCERIEAEGGNAFMNYSVPSAVIRFRQGFGRLIRCKTDRGIVVIADRRLVTRRYGYWFYGSLPVQAFTYAERSHFLDAVEDFFDSTDPAFPVGE